LTPRRRPLCQKSICSWYMLERLELCGNADIQIGDTIAQLGKDSDVVGEEVACADIQAEACSTSITASARDVVAAVIGVAATQDVIGKHDAAVQVELVDIKPIVVICAAYPDNGIVPFFRVIRSGEAISLITGITPEADDPRATDIPYAPLVLQA